MSCRSQKKSVGLRADLQEGSEMPKQMSYVTTGATTSAVETTELSACPHG